jgi:hypothetical protein
MKKDKLSLYSGFVILVFSFVMACANTPNLIGKWKEIGKTATLELWKTPIPSEEKQWGIYSAEQKRVSTGS